MTYSIRCSFIGFFLFIHVLQLVPTGANVKTKKTPFSTRLAEKTFRQQVMKTTCHLLKEDFYVAFCKGRYKADIATRYRDRLVPLNTPYTIFNSEHEVNRYIVAFDMPQLADCKKLKVLASNMVLCVNPDYKVVRVSWHTVYCFLFNLQYVDELVKECRGQGHGCDMDQNQYAALMYNPDFFRVAGSCSIHHCISMLLFVTGALLIIR